MEYNQTSFSGGMNLLVDDTRLADNEYRVGFNIRNRFDVLDGVKTATEEYAPNGVKQGLYTFGDYLLLFVSGIAYYRNKSETGWHEIVGFAMSSAVPRLYVCAVPVSTTQDGRTLNATGSNTAPIITVPKTSDVSVAGSPSGVVVQDGINQPFFIWVDDNSNVLCRTVQKYSEWKYDPTGADDRREYVPVGTFMEWYDGILFVVSADGSTLYRSVTGRPLDFVINIDINGDKAGDATTTSYSVGIGGITALKTLNTDGLMVSAQNRYCYVVSTNRSPNATSLFGEPTFIRRYLFDSGCINEKCIVDILGDFAFVDPEGLRSFNAVQQLLFEGRNSIFSLKIASLFKGIIQDGIITSAISYDNYALFSLNTVYGYRIVVYDTLNKCYVGLDDQTGGIAITQFAKIDTQTTELYCITANNKFLRLYNGTKYATSLCRLKAACSQNPKVELQLTDFRCVLNNFRQASSVTCSVLVNNRLSGTPITKFVAYKDPTQSLDTWFDDMDSMLSNLFFNWTGANQGWKMSFVIEWTGGGSVTNVQATATEQTPLNPLLSQTKTPQ